MAFVSRRSILSTGGTAGALLAVPGVSPTANAESVRHADVAPGVRLDVRGGPGTSHPITGVLSEGAKVPISCQTPGTTATGPYGTSDTWDDIATAEFVSGGSVLTGSDGCVRPRCFF
ncbi:hypothetical protein [Streptomyces sp. NPDC057877]|uniref:hypothetical protein n=1 Tax=Streptomyces sp. NPDC057877 TaxID=3346269 RepID=UPI0036CC0FCF